jgi:hypothetical protein
LKWYDGGGENEITSKGFLKLKCLSPLKMLTSPLFEETFGAFLFSLFFLFLALSLEDIGVLMILEEKITSSKTSFQLVILAVDAYSKVELCTPTWLNHDYGDGRVVDILTVDTYSGMDICTPIFVGGASNYCGWQIIFRKNQNSDGHIP